MGPPLPSTTSSAHLRTLLEPCVIPSSSPRSHYRNWARTYAATPHTAFQPTSEDQCAAILKLAELEGRVVRAVGSGHSPSDLPCTSDFMVRMDRLDGLIELDREKLVVTIQAGMTLMALNDLLDAEGLAMPNLGSISDTTIAGVISTGTHGTGIDYGCLATHVIALDVLLADGTRAHCSRSESEDLFLASLCGLGTTGLIMHVSIQVTKAFQLKEVRTVMHIDDVIRDVETLASDGEFVRLWWAPHIEQVAVTRANRTSTPEPPQSPFSWFWNSFIAGTLGEFLLYLGLFIPIFEWWGNLLKSRITVVPYTSVGRSDKIFNLDCGEIQYTTEWNVPFEEAKATLMELKAWCELSKSRGDQLPSFPIEVRFSKQDDIWLSPAYGRTSCWIGIVKYKPYGRPVPFQSLSQQFEEILQAHNGRPHWAKTHSFSPSGLRSLYPRFDDFVSVVRRVDPKGRFQNEYVRRHVFQESLIEDEEGQVSSVHTSVYAKNT
ncbi:L-gulonolactone/D-arabinono-1,4-lactone oxidase [Clavulina sp. PMI_390]|nr:L-gulonolactone/D-arabinono-1,4-lactone oxidase [Clavulina sp. PMI_390]